MVTSLVMLAACTTPADPEPSPSLRDGPSANASPSPRTTDQARLDAELISAAWANDVDGARRLIAEGADVNAKDDTEQSAYLISTSEGYLALLELTLAAGADVDAKDSFNGTGLIRAADRGHADIAGRLVRAGVEVDHINRLGWTALHEAIILGDGSARYVDTVRVLVAAGADLQLASRRDAVRPLQHAETRGHAEIAALLRAALADDTTTQQATRALLAAAREGDADAVAIAVRAGADPATRDERGRTARQLAENGDHPAVLRLLDYLGAP